MSAYVSFFFLMSLPDSLCLMSPCLFVYSCLFLSLSLCLFMSVSLGLLMSLFVSLCLLMSSFSSYLFISSYVASCLLMSLHISLCLFISPYVSSCSLCLFTFLMSPHVTSCLLMSLHVSLCFFMSPYNNRLYSHNKCSMTRAMIDETTMSLHVCVYPFMFPCLFITTHVSSCLLMSTPFLSLYVFDIFLCFLCIFVS